MLITEEMECSGCELKLSEFEFTTSQLNASANLTGLVGEFDEILKS